MTYFINEKEKCIVNGINGDIIRPSCYDDLVLYYKYVLQTEGLTTASNLLQRVIEGEKIISNLHEFAAKQGEKK